MGNIGMELAAMPAVIFMDEPTSGLDGAATVQLAACLANLRQSGLTIVCVIHQPRWAVYSRFSHLLLLGAGGQMVYCGEALKIQAYFEGLFFRLPENETPADWMIDIVSGLSVRFLGEGADAERDTSFTAPDDLFRLWNERCRNTDHPWMTNENLQHGHHDRRPRNFCSRALAVHTRILQRHQCDLLFHFQEPLLLATTLPLLLHFRFRPLLHDASPCNELRSLYDDDVHGRLVSFWPWTPCGNHDFQCTDITAAVHLLSPCVGHHVAADHRRRAVYCSAFLWPVVQHGSLLGRAHSIPGTHQRVRRHQR